MCGGAITTLRMPVPAAVKQASVDRLSVLLGCKKGDVVMTFSDLRDYPVDERDRERSPR